MSTVTLLRRGYRDSLRNYWFAVNSGVFVVGGLLLMLLGQNEAAVLGYRSFARTLAGLMQLALVVVPLMALFPAAATLAGEREVGTLEFLLAQPVTRGEVYSGKWGGVAVAVVLSLVVGFGLMGAVALAKGVPLGLVAVLLALTLLLGVAFVSVGLWISSWTASTGRATSLALSVWLVLLALGSLGLMGSFVAWGLPPMVLEVWAFLNPVEAFRMAMVVVLDPGLDVLGPVGADLVERLGEGALVAISVGSLVAWSAVAFVAGRRRFGRGEP